MFKENYERFNIKNIQMSTNFFLSIKLFRVWYRYKKMGLEVNFMNKEFNNKNSYFNKFLKESSGIDFLMQVYWLFVIL